MSSVLIQLQNAVVQQLQQRLCLSGTKVLARRVADLDSQIEAAVQSALGLTILVLDPIPRRVEAEVPGPIFLEIALTIRIIENLLINAGGAGPLVAAERTSQVLHLWNWPDPDGEGVLRLAETNPWSVPTGPMRGAVVLDLHFLAEGSLAVSEAR
jgi:hypothetical protein